MRRTRLERVAKRLGDDEEKAFQNGLVRNSRVREEGADELRCAVTHDKVGGLELATRTIEALSEKSFAELPWEIGPFPNRNNQGEEIMSTFIIDCPSCKAKVGADQGGFIDRRYSDEHTGEPFGERILIGKCPSCGLLLVGRAEQIEFEGLAGTEHDTFSDVVRVYPKPPRHFTSYRIPETLNQSLLEADRSLQAGANIAACVMLGRALEALCRDALEPKQGEQGWEADERTRQKGRRRLMLSAGIRELREKKIIDDRLYDWSQSLSAVRNLAAHPENITVSRQDAEDLQAFVYAITEYVYDLTDRYNEFKQRENVKKPSAQFGGATLGDILGAAVWAKRDHSLKVDRGDGDHAHGDDEGDTEAP